jgi:hypothetical protein
MYLQLDTNGYYTQAFCDAVGKLSSVNRCHYNKVLKWWEYDNEGKEMGHSKV